MGNSGIKASRGQSGDAPNKDFQVEYKSHILMNQFFYLKMGLKYFLSMVGNLCSFGI